MHVRCVRVCVFSFFDYPITVRVQLFTKSRRLGDSKKCIGKITRIPDESRHTEWKNSNSIRTTVRSTCIVLGAFRSRYRATAVAAIAATMVIFPIVSRLSTQRPVTIEWNYSMRRRRLHRLRRRLRQQRRKWSEKKAGFFFVFRCAKLGVYLSWCREITSVLNGCHVRSSNIPKWKRWRRRQRQRRQRRRKKKQWKSAKWKWNCASVRARKKEEENNDFHRAAAKRTHSTAVIHGELKQEGTGRTKAAVKCDSHICQRTQYVMIRNNVTPF